MNNNGFRINVFYHIFKFNFATVSLNKPFLHELYLSNVNNLKILLNKNIFVKSYILYNRSNRIMFKLKNEKNNQKIHSQINFGV